MEGDFQQTVYQMISGMSADFTKKMRGEKRKLMASWSLYEMHMHIRVYICAVMCINILIFQ